MTDDDRPMPDRIEIDGCVTFCVDPARSVQELIDRWGFDPAQIVSDRTGTEYYMLVDVLRDVWFKAMWRAHWMAPEERAAWFTTGDWM